MPGLLRERILVLDGAMGTMVQRYRFSEEDFRGERFADHPKDVRGNTDLLSLTQARRDPRDPRGVPRRGRGHHQHQHVHLDPRSPRPTTACPTSPASSTRRAPGWPARRPTTPRPPTGGPGSSRARSARPTAPARSRRTSTTRRPATSASGSWPRPIARRPRARSTRRRRPAAARDDLRHAQRQGRDLRHRGGVRGPRAADPDRGQRDDRRRVRPHAVGADARGVLDERPARAPDARRPQLRARREAAPRARRGDEPARRRAARRVPERGPAQRARRLRRDARPDVDDARRVGARGPDQPRRLVLREHARAHGRHRRRPSRASRRASSRSGTHSTRLAGLEPLAIPMPGGAFVNIGERTNVTGSRKFARLMLGMNDPSAPNGARAKAEDEAVAIARDQVANGAVILDVNMDEAMLDGVEAMTRFLRRLGSEPDIAAVPVMVDSSKWSVIEAGLQQLQGRPVVNSISLKEGEDEFLRQAALCRRYGAAVVVMAFDEDGQADSVDRRVAVLTRAYRLLTETAGLRTRRHHPRPQHLRDRDRHRGARPLRDLVLRGDAPPQGGAAGRPDQRRRVQRVVRVPRQRPRARGDPRRVPVPRDPRRARHGDRQRGCARPSTTTSTPTCSSASRTWSWTAGPTPPSACSTSRRGTRAAPRWTARPRT